jgi:5-methylcytosine-specific restriction endonuclease McrA
MKCYDKTGVKNPFWGKKHSKETKQKFSENPDRVIFKKGSLNPNYTRFNEEFFRGVAIRWWQRFLKKTVGKCEKCGYLDHLEVLEVHHLDKIRKNNVRENLILLCPNCHEVWHLLDKSGRYSPNKYERKKS